jgi:hypothetical protein
VKARVDGRELYMGGPALLKTLGVAVPERLRQAALDASNRASQRFT